MTELLKSRSNSSFKKKDKQTNTNQLSQLGKQPAKSFQAPFLDCLRAFLPDTDRGLHRYRLWTVPRGARRLQRTAHQISRFGNVWFAASEWKIKDHPITRSRAKFLTKIYCIYLVHDLNAYKRGQFLNAFHSEVVSHQGCARLRRCPNDFHTSLITLTPNKLWMKSYHLRLLAHYKNVILGQVTP